MCSLMCVPGSEQCNVQGVWKEEAGLEHDGMKYTEGARADRLKPPVAGA